MRICMSGNGAVSEVRPDRYPGGDIVYVYMVSFVAALGGLLFGFDTGVISGAIPFITEHFHLDAVRQGFAVSNVLVGCVIGASLAGTLSDRYGRKKILIFTALFFTLTSLLSAIPRTYIELIIARFIGGLAVGVASVISPVYIAEIAPSGIRGRLVSINQFTIVFGMLLTYITNWLLVDTGPNNWRWMFLVQAPAAILFFFALFFVPESPRWLTKQNRLDEARAILSRVGGKSHAEAEMREINAMLNKEEGSFMELFRPGFRKAVILGVILAFFSTCTGIGPVTYYAPTIFLGAGFESASAALFASIIVVLTILLCTFIVIWLVDRMGRIPLLIIGLSGMTVSMALMGYTYQNTGIDPTWIIIPILLFVGFFAMSLGDIVWVMLAEIFPNKVRGRGMAIGTMVVWLSDFSVSQTFPWMTEVIGRATFYLYGGLSAAALVFVIFFLPETKGKSLEEIERMWEENR